MMDPEVLNVLQQEPITAIAQELLDVRHKLATLPAVSTANSFQVG